MEKLSASRDVAENKLLILYILEKIDIAIGSVELTNYILEQRLIPFLTYQQRIHELIVTNHINSATQNGQTQYSITGEGAGLLSAMSELLPQTEKNRVDRTIRKLRRQTINERAVTAYYTPEDEYNGVVRIELNEGELSVLSLEIATASKEEAYTICRNWKSHAAEIYAGIVDLLLEQQQPGDDTGEEQAEDGVIGLEGAEK